MYGLSMLQDVRDIGGGESTVSSLLHCDFDSSNPWRGLRSWIGLGSVMGFNNCGRIHSWFERGQRCCRWIEKDEVSWRRMMEDQARDLAGLWMVLTDCII